MESFNIFIAQPIKIPMSNLLTKQPLWIPSSQRMKSSNMIAFMQYVNSNLNQKFQTYHELYEWSVENIEEFWKAIWEFGSFKYSQSYSTIMSKDDFIKTKWFEGAKLNFAENLLNHRGSKIALIGVRENLNDVIITYDELFHQVARCSCRLRSLGVQKGDRVAAFISNIPEAVIGMLASVSIGAIWTSCSPDFGSDAAIDRFGQVGPIILFASDSYSYNGKIFDCTEKIKSICENVNSIEKVILIRPYELHENSYLKNSSKFIDYNKINDFISNKIEFEQLEFDHPLYILYSSGTTGKPKCIVHGTGRVLLQHFKELSLHTDVKSNDVITYFTTTGWMMWNWLVSSLMLGATVVLVDGNPVYPDCSRLWNLIDQHQITIFGTSPKFLSICEEIKYTPKRNNQLSSLRTILSTGSPLSIENFKWVYENVKDNVQLSSISGGTDIISCFMLGNPLLPVYAGEIQCRGLGMKVEVYNEKGKPVFEQKGELVCTKPFPSMPIYFWNDPEMKKYSSSYFEFYPGIWRHGDYIMITETGGIIVFGRSDTTLNPGGVRIGTAEIYNVVEKMDEISDSIVVGQNWNNDIRIILFVVLKEKYSLDENLKNRIKSELKSKISPRHVPSKIIQVNEIPRTINMKKVEIAVTRIINGQPVENLSSIANPNCLKQFENIEELLN